ncbi:hypothetical protein [Bradyrhizobium sp.]|uniref:hypothetical protein n=1 Tax=Bradyrhizobium sp. TaxID=376 RepID=UPI0039E21438
MIAARKGTGAPKITSQFQSHMCSHIYSVRRTKFRRWLSIAADNRRNLAQKSVETAAFGGKKFEFLPVDWWILTLRRRGLWGLERPLCARMSALKVDFAIS